MYWENIRDEKDSDNRSFTRINFKQVKTEGQEYQYISNQARSLLGERRSPNDRVFYGLRYSSTYNSELLKWCMRAGVTKHITFHCASRHTFATLQIALGTDIYTVSKMLGHTNIKTTQHYAKILDAKVSEDMQILKGKLNFPKKNAKKVI